MNNVMKVIKLYLSNMFKSIMAHICLILNLIYILSLVIASFKIGSKLAFVILSIIFIYFEIFKVIYLKVKDMDRYSNFPVSNKRYTRKNEKGDIEMSEAEVIMAMDYLCRVEDFIEKEGLKNEM